LEAANRSFDPWTLLQGAAQIVGDGIGGGTQLARKPLNQAKFKLSRRRDRTQEVAGSSPAPSSAVKRHTVRRGAKLCLPAPGRRLRLLELSLDCVDIGGDVELRLRAVGVVKDYGLPELLKQFGQRRPARPAPWTPDQVRRLTGPPVDLSGAEPEAVLTDNGKVFTAGFGPHRGEVLFDRICKENGIRHLLTSPRSPTITGKIERFHKSLRTELLAEESPSTLEEAGRSGPLGRALQRPPATPGPGDGHPRRAVPRGDLDSTSRRRAGAPPTRGAPSPGERPGGRSRGDLPAAAAGRRRRKHRPAARARTPRLGAYHAGRRWVARC